MPEQDSRIRVAVTAAPSKSDRARPMVLMGIGLVVLIAGAWLIFGGGGDSDLEAKKGLAQIQQESYERRIENLKAELDELAAENEKLRSALIKAESELTDIRALLRRESGRVN